MKWQKHDDPITGATVRYYGPYREFTHPEHKAIMVFSDRVETGEVKGAYDGRGRWRERRVSKIRHSITISCGPYGEHGYQDALPFGTTSAKAQQHALRIAREINDGKHGNTYGLQFDI